ncbi:MAG TPA: S8 family serine peptidase, partial [Urbifossiella sp.]|nr:S8 family serine peptidase [Urbifossiella sp.]
MVHITRWLLRSPRPATRPARVRLLAEWLEDRAVPAALPDLVTLARLDTGGDRTGPLTKVGFDLALLSREADAGLAAPSNSLLQVAHGYVAVEAVPAGNATALGSALAGLGFVPSAPLAGWLPIRSVGAAAELPELAALRPAYRLVTSAGAAMTQGDAAQRSDDVRRLLGLDGTGVRVGVISDSFNSLGGASGDVASGDLPGNVTVLHEGAGADEGRAMLQVIHDVAPGAQLMFAAAGATQQVFADRIRELASAGPDGRPGADIIVDDVTFPAAPMFQDGPAARAVDEVVASGVVYFSAAGNLGRQSYESAYRGGDNLGSSGTGLIPTSANFLAHDFDAGAGVDYFQSVTLPAGRTTFSFQWVDRYASAGGPGARIDMDMAVFDENGVFLMSIGGFNSNVGGDPVEVFEVDAGTTGGRYRLALGKFSVNSPDPVLVKYVAFADGFVQDEYDTQSSTVFGHANATGSATVGAARYSDTPRFGTDPGVARAFTGRGGTQVFTFDANGDPTGSATRHEPRFVAPDGVNTTFFGPTDDEPDGRPNFTGTSAAAPHAAAVAALMLQANRTLTPAQVTDTLAATALDLGAPGVDVDTGAGLIQALPAVLAVGSHFDVTLDGDDGDDAFLVRRDSSGANVEFFKNGLLVAAIPADKLGRVTVQGGAGSDTLTVDHVNGEPLASAGLSFAGGETPGDDDRLVVTGYRVEFVVVSHDGPETGTVQVGTTGLVSFAEVEPVELAGESSDLVVNLPTTPNPDVAVGAAGLAGFSSVTGSTFESTRFRNPTHALVVGLGAGGNTVALRALDIGFAATVTILGGLGMDAVTLFGGGGDDAVTYAPDANDGGVLTLAGGSAATSFTLTGIESLAADGLGQPGADAVTVNAPIAGVVFGTAGGSGTVNVATAAGSALLGLVYRNFEQAAVAAT